MQGFANDYVLKTWFKLRNDHDRLQILKILQNLISGSGGLTSLVTEISTYVEEFESKECGL